MKTRLIFLMIFGILFAACKRDKNLSEYMVNNWQTSYIKIEMPSAYGKDSLQVYEDDFSKENTILAQSTYNSDGVFKAWYLQSDGTKGGETSGKWYVKGDSLYLEYVSKGKITNPVYFAEKTKEGLALKSFYDWDGDGEKDDLLTMKSKIINLK